ncbi:helix-turn-helix domain-containing protein [Polymorphobacter fuscus]|uniref:Helix-turn-helix domain-containing protein n=1 Tax=Sandarakinorhabdus fusca TaxID=1439888 RepID=A0A7C9KXT1_9SPHN|nr:helix-turn-helix transcriptional regulator [Polymorphobacter fuscus]KAB7646578.1 helix-turn-helix transcriptional regulator [Polymorphobacter fuscus]MQT17406.1 helix-turn-helix domain-containing protein [Polymorphobacter fuscus]
MLTRIREVRKAKGLTLLDVAENCVPPTTAQTIGRLETGTRTVSVGWLNRIAAALGVESSELVTLADRPDIAVAAILATDGAQAPRKPLTVVPPAPTSAQVGILVEAAQGEYRAGDVLWAENLAAADYGRAINRDVLVPRPVGRFVFGRLVAVDGSRLQVLPLTPGARQQVIADAPWLAVVRTLIRTL